MEDILKRNLFEVENARNLSSIEVVNTFVPTKSFWRLLSPKNHIVLGARGSGKTELVRMLAHDHLSQFDDKRAKEIIQRKEFIGIYVPTRLEWVGGLKNKQWQTEAEAEKFFQWRLNISTCAALLVTLKSCLDTYIKNHGDRARTERDLARALYKTWTDNPEGSCETIFALHELLEDIEHGKQAQITRARITGIATSNELMIGAYFESELFSPLRRAITLASRALDFPENSVWMLCLDEAEFLEPHHHRILNSHLRAHPGNLVFKITTMPYYHHTLETNMNACLNVGHDFEYIYIDKDPIEFLPSEDSGEYFAKMLFNKRAEQSAGDYKWEDFEALLGASVLLDSRISDWSADSKMMALMKKHANSATQARAGRLAGTPDFKDQISRKIHGALLLREAVAQKRGRAELDVYSGIRMAIRCSDANPRRLIRIINLFISERGKSETLNQIKPQRQTMLLTAFSNSTLSRVQSEPQNGPDLYKFLSAAGNYMRRDLHDNLLGTDQVSSIAIDVPITDNEWTVIKNAVGLGLLYPNINANSGDQMPERIGVFRLAYVLAPNFKILPRKGKPVSIKRINQQADILVLQNTKS
ncbi:ORC-CDC6 family AAA ATPase [Candidatus Ferrigenium straubiae]|jgi:hypothetical protein|uniref:ORC-CDC6 family AAA ATPase n=1 Tax=Candidatus Ferrigenium straubiae TaxID=2919506 RepID=UPI003F4AB0AE